jgi:hypothetical protein
MSPLPNYQINQSGVGVPMPPLYNCKTKTADYTILESDHGYIIDNLGATAAVILTLPVLGNLPDGWWIIAFGAVLAQDLTVASGGSLDNIVTVNDIAADSVKLGTANERAGGGWLFVKRGTKWFCFTMTGETQTVTIA